jgi:hypothetical protein
MRLSGALALGAAAACVLVGAARGGQVFQDTIHDERTFVVADYCGVEGMAVRITRILDMRFQVVTHGPDGLAYFMQHGRVAEVHTNLANGKSLTSEANVVEKDQSITVNDDGTLTIIVLATGNAVLYGENGKAIARNPGQVRFELLIDDGGTPSDPSDDVVTRLGVVKGSTGRSDDFCDAGVSALS